MDKLTLNIKPYLAEENSAQLCLSSEIERHVIDEAIRVAHENGFNVGVIPPESLRGARRIALNRISQGDTNLFEIQTLSPVGLPNQTFFTIGSPDCVIKELSLKRLDMRTQLELKIKEAEENDC